MSWNKANRGSIGGMMFFIISITRFRRLHVEIIYELVHVQVEIFQTQTRLRCTQPFIQYRPNIEIMLKCERDVKSSQIFYLSIELKQGCYKILTIFEFRRSERTHILH